MSLKNEIRTKVQEQWKRLIKAYTTFKMLEGHTRGDKLCMSNSRPFQVESVLASSSSNPNAQDSKYHGCYIPYTPLRTSQSEAPCEENGKINLKQLHWFVSLTTALLSHICCCSPNAYIIRQFWVWEFRRVAALASEILRVLTPCLRVCACFGCFAP